MREKYIEESVCAFARQNGWFTRKLEWVGRHGAPDRFCAKGGKVFFIEFKAPGKTPTANQEREIAAMRAVGITVHVIDDIEAGKALFA